jgi:hypothetical protein
MPIYSQTCYISVLRLWAGLWLRLVEYLIAASLCLSVYLSKEQ